MFPWIEVEEALAESVLEDRHESARRALEELGREIKRRGRECQCPARVEDDAGDCLEAEECAEGGK